MDDVSHAVETIDAVSKAHVCSSVDDRSKLKGWRGTDSGRFILREQELRNICSQVCQINQIPAIADMAGKHA